MKTIDVCFFVNNDYAKYLSVTLVSILSNSKAPLYFHIITEGLTVDNMRKIESLKNIRDFNIEYVSAKLSLVRDVPQSCQKRITNETNFRLLISSLKKDLDKCIILDADLILVGDIEKLWNVDVEDYYIAAVTDQAPLAPKSWTEQLPLPKNYTYVNTGVCVVNLKKWRTDHIEEKIFINIKKYEKLLQYPDQDILNITLASNVRYISPKFNALPVLEYYDKKQEREAFQEPIVLHWAGGRKPWRFPHANYADVYFRYARVSPFYEGIIYSNLEGKNIVANCNLPISSPKNSLSDELVRLKKIMLEMSRLPDYRRKLQRIRWKVHFSLGERRQRYLRRKEQIKNQIKAAEKFMKDI